MMSVWLRAMDMARTMDMVDTDVDVDVDELGIVIDSIVSIMRVLM
jgi:hypothetical protein